jgi:hypothetical protein
VLGSTTRVGGGTGGAFGSISSGVMPSANASSNEKTTSEHAPGTAQSTIAVA